MDIVGIMERKGVGAYEKVFMSCLFSSCSNSLWC